MFEIKMIGVEYGVIDSAEIIDCTVDCLMIIDRLVIYCTEVIDCD